MLLPLLPGIREARVPLAAGYIAVLAAWLYLQDNLPDSSSNTDEGYGAFARIGDLVGPVGVAVILSFVAYLIGAVLVQLGPALLRNFDPLTRWARPTDTKKFLDASDTELPAKLAEYLASAPSDTMADRYPRYYYPDSSYATLNISSERNEYLGLLTRLSQVVQEELGDAEFARGALPSLVARNALRPSDAAVIKAIEDDQGEEAPGSELFEAIHRRAALMLIRRDIASEIAGGQVDDRLLANAVELYGELTRLKAEALLRIGIVLPLVALLPAILLNVPWPIAVEIIFVLGYMGFIAVLGRQAFGQWHRSVLIALRAVADAVVTTPSIDAIARTAAD